MRASVNDRLRPDLAVALIALLSLPLFFYGLGDTYLWQDEAQTALLGRSVLTEGMPMVGQGAESLSALEGRDAGIRGIYFQIAWLQAYLAAASFQLFGESSWSARLPFALAGWSCIPLVAWVLRSAGASVIATRMAALLLAVSVPFIICSRQARYYALTAALTLLATGTYTVLADRVKEGRLHIAVVPVWFGAAATFLVLSFDLTAIGVLAALALHWGLTTRVRGRLWNRAFWIPWAVSGLVLAVWLAFSMTAASRQEHAGLRALPGRLWHGAFYYLGQINAHMMPLPVFLTLITLCPPKATEKSQALSGNLRAMALLAAVALGGISGAILAPQRYFRYAVPLFPFVLGIAAVGLATVWSLGRGGKALAGTMIVALVTTNAPFVWSQSALAALASRSGFVTVRDRVHEYRVPLVLLLQELRDPPRGPIAAVSEYLRGHANRNHVLVTTYGELPLKFHTNLRVYGGETAQLPVSGVDADWIWSRHRIEVYPAERASVEWVEEQLARGVYRSIQLPAVDRRWENREDPELHIFSNPGPNGPPVTIYRLSKGAE